ncbi:hypothetical protein F3Y22_tig00000340pilonHSYRG00870 [Hibiscus syriacus]|uniref:Uncharacterized protein n=1 Tax=Hibiscus syriacus TaxID=106335 RepID=A0A6A3D6R4_HIBSY|nr:hypothetical protein F3Y22_tig00000340pilonHSYRG00870 [Hibiscus syriacus]
MDLCPVATFQVHEYLRPKLCDLYENDSIFDKFECCLSGDGLRVATGSYSNLFRVFGCAPGSTESTTLEANKNPMRRQVQTPSRPSRPLSSITRVVRRGSETPGADANGSSFDFTTKLLHLAWNPIENLIACAAANSLYLLLTVEVPFPFPPSSDIKAKMCLRSTRCSLKIKKWLSQIHEDANLSLFPGGRMISPLLALVLVNVCAVIGYWVKVRPGGGSMTAKGGGRRGFRD